MNKRTLKNPSPYNRLVLLALAGLMLCFLHCSGNKRAARTTEPRETGKIARAFNWTVELQEMNREGVISPSGFRDDLISVSMEVLPNVLSLTLENTSQDSIYVAWNDCQFEFPGGFRSKIVHSEVEFHRRHQPLLNEYIYPGTTEYRFIAPRIRSDWHRLEKKWRSYPILKGPAEKWVGQEFAFILFINHQKNLLPYVFKFSVKDVYPVTFERRDNNLYQIKPWYREMSPSSAGKKLFSEPQKKPVSPVVSGIAEQDPPITEENILEPSLDSSQTRIIGSVKPPKSDSSSTRKVTEKPLSPPPDSVISGNSPKTSASQKGIQALLQRMEAEKTKESTAPSADTTAAPPLDPPAAKPLDSRSAKAESDSLRNFNREQAYLDSLEQPENIPLFEEETPLKPVKKENDSDSLRDKKSVFVPPEPILRKSPGSL